MELKTNYQYTYFIYPFAIKEENYKKYILHLIQNKKYQMKFFDNFKDVDLYKYFVPNVKEKIFQDFSFGPEKVSQFKKLSTRKKQKILQKQNCCMFEYLLEDPIQGKTDEQVGGGSADGTSSSGIFFSISKIELICFQTGICFLIFKTHLMETADFADILNFNYKFENINFENKNIKKLEHIKIQTNRFNNIREISEILEDITGKKIESRKLDIDENLFLIYTYACLESTYWNTDDDFKNIENEFVKLAEVEPSDVTIHVDYDKLSTMADSSYMKIRANNKCVALICSSKDPKNYTKLSQVYENEYLYTYIIALHQKYYLKKLSQEFKENAQKTNQKFLDFTNDIWISEMTTNSFGQKLYKRFKDKLNLEDLFQEVKNKYDIYYKKCNIEKYKKMRCILLILLLCGVVIGIIDLLGLIFLK